MGPEFKLKIVEPSSCYPRAYLREGFTSLSVLLGPIGVSRNQALSLIPSEDPDGGIDPAR